MTDWKTTEDPEHSGSSFSGYKQKKEHIAPALNELQWLPADDWVVFKILFLTFKSLHGLAPDYVEPPRQLRSSKKNLLELFLPFRMFPMDIELVAS